MLVEIEKGVLDQLDEKLILPARKITAGKADGKGVHSLSIPKVVVGIASGKGIKVSDAVTQIAVRIFVLIEFSNLRDEKTRRHGCYPIVLSVISFLIGQKLGLDIKALSFIAFTHTTSDEEAAAGLINYTIEFSTSFDLRKLSEEEAGALLQLGLEYMLKPGDDVADSESVITLTGGS